MTFYLLHDFLLQQLVYSTLYKDKQAEALEKSCKTMCPVALREAAGCDHNKASIFLHMHSYWASYINWVTNKRICLKLDMSINFQDPVHFLQCSKGVKRLKYKVSGNKLIAAACLST